MNHKKVTVVKASGKIAPFDKHKLEASLLRSGANKEVVEEILSEVHSMLYNGITTKKIYKRAFYILKKRNDSTAAKYKLKKALLELGPEGFAFEILVAELLKYQGYTTKVSEILQGKCVTHEIDVVAEKENEVVLVECKFHNDAKRICNVKVPLYIHSRFRDIQNQIAQKKGESKNYKCLIATNTRFSVDAKHYASCVGLQTMSWDFPVDNNLKDLIDKSGLHPITCLTKMTKAEKQQLLGMGRVLCSDVANNPKVLESINMSPARRAHILNEIQNLNPH
jgi:Holliday junction resolvase-like predicted endonuclease